MSIIYTIASILCVLVIASLLWRFISNRQSIPCPSWLAWMVEMDNPFTKVSHASSIIEDSSISEGMTILDAGCGPGRVAIPVAQKIGVEGKVVAMDIQQAMLEKVRKKAQNANLSNIDYLEAGLGDGNLQENYFDRVLLVTVLGEIPNQEKALKEIFYSLKESGLLTVTEIIFDPHFQRKGSLLNLAQGIGFQERAHFGGCFAYTMILEKSGPSKAKKMKRE